MEPFISWSGVAAPMLADDINTDQITPVYRDLHPDYAKLLFARKRKRSDGSDDPDFVLNKPQFKDAKILVAGQNFGCGSSRESAVWAFVAVGIRCIVARSFADIYRDNCLKNGVLPVVLAAGDAEAFEKLVVEADGKAPATADLRTQTVTAPGGRQFKFDIATEDRTILLEGLDDIALTLKHAPDIAAWEQRMQRERPWLQNLSRS
ncbi:MAG: 3-isopropylmalate dehydratase small subunit [Alphaproteobacteria bacterium]|nr:3-isopropylmalate dehydratase small subunit [Alphaproteobacteria bacterium]